MLFSCAVYSLHFKDRHFFNYEDRLDIRLDANQIFRIWWSTVLSTQAVRYVKRKIRVIFIETYLRSCIRGLVCYRALSLLLLERQRIILWSVFPTHNLLFRLQKVEAQDLTQRYPEFKKTRFKMKANAQFYDVCLVVSDLFLW